MTATTIRVQMAQRKDTAANWTAANPILLSGEIGYETDTKKFKIGNGSTNWNSLAYLPIPDGSGNLTITGNLEIGSTGSLTFEGSTADGFETTLAVTNPTADRTITLPNQSGNVLVSGNASIIDADIAANAEIAVSKLADGTARQLLQTDAAGTGVEWASNVDIPGTLDVTGAATFDAAVTVAGDLTVNGTTTTISTQNLLVEDKNIIIGDVAIPTDVTADGGGITLKGATDKTINWVDATDAWTSSERFSVPLSTAALPSLTFTGDPNTGIYSPGADQVAISTGGSGRLFVDASGRLGIGTSSPNYTLDVAGTINANAAVRTSNGTYIGILGSEAFAAGVVGVGSASNHPLVLGTNSTERLRITSAGLVGVGTSSPGTTLEISSGAGSVPNLNGTSGNLAITQPSLLTSLQIGGYDTAPYALWLQGQNKSGSTFPIVLNPAGGNVGVGTISPDVLLDAQAISGNAKIQAKETTTSKRIQLEANTAYHAFYADGAVPVYHYSNGSIALTIDSSQRVGIGTTSPSTTLSIGAFASSSFNGGVCLNRGPSAYNFYEASDGTNSVIFGLDNTLTVAKIGSVNSYPIGFFTGNAERARIDSSGRLLVGTSSQSGGALLQVNGDRVRIATAKTPASATDTGTAGEICWDASYVYVCTATNTWKRSALTTW